jgi:putative transposase
LIEAARQLSQRVGVVGACRSLRVSRASYYRKINPIEEALDTVKTALLRAGEKRALKSSEQSEVVELLNSSRFVDQAPREVFAALLDEGRYLCSVSTMYRLLVKAGEVKERRDQLRHPAYSRPELVARGPNEVWSWDITKLLGPVKWVYYYLYVMIDIYSRYVVGWMVANKESGVLAERLIEESLRKQEVEARQLVIHSDRGAPMKSKPVAMLLADLGVTKSHSRPRVSNDNPYSESQFKTLKYSPEFPARFGSLEDARGFSGRFFGWYNQHHHHSGIGLLTPEVVHYGKASEVIAARQRVLEEAYQRHPERFPRGVPRAPELPKEVWINRPGSDSSSGELLTKFDNQVSHFY